MRKLFYLALVALLLGGCSGTVPTDTYFPQVHGHGSQLGDDVVFLHYCYPLVLEYISEFAAGLQLLRIDNLFERK